MKILHIANDYLGSRVYLSLFEALKLLNIKQNVLCFIRKNQFVSDSLCYARSRKTFDELIIRLGYFNSTFGRVIPFVVNYFIYKIILAKSPSLIEVDIIHAHTLFANGSLANFIYKKKKINYIITIRNTDINLVFKYFIHLEKQIISILIDSKALVFNNPSYLIKMQIIFKNNPILIEKLKSKAFIIPHGIDKFWQENIFKPKKKPEDSVYNLLFVGEISKNKNIDYLINVVKLLGPHSVRLKIVGGTLNKKSNIKYLCEIQKSVIPYKNIEYLGEINDKDYLLQLYRESHIFCMTSIYENFGLVYLEALSQGSPIIYSKGQGVDGLFEPGEVGYPVNLNSVDDGVTKLIKIMDNFERISQRTIEIIQRFGWEQIGIKYKELVHSLNIERNIK